MDCRQLSHLRELRAFVLGSRMAHDPEAAPVIEAALASEVVRAGSARIRTLPASDEAVALVVLNALAQAGLEVVRKPPSLLGTFW